MFTCTTLNTQGQDMTTSLSKVLITNFPFQNKYFCTFNSLSIDDYNIFQNSIILGKESVGSAGGVGIELVEILLKL